MTTFTPAILITGYDNRDNPFAFWKSINGWVDSYNECATDVEFVRKYVFPNVRTAVIGPIVMTGAEWVEAGCPISLSDEQITAIEEATRLEAATEAEQVAAEVASDNQWLDSDTSRIALPQVNANGNLQWQGVEFDMSAIVERTKARSAALKSEIDKRMERAEQDWKQRKASVKLHSPKVIG